MNNFQSILNYEIAMKNAQDAMNKHYERNDIIDIESSKHLFTDAFLTAIINLGNDNYNNTKSHRR